MVFYLVARSVAVSVADVVTDVALVVFGRWL